MKVIHTLFSAGEVHNCARGPNAVYPMKIKEGGRRLRGMALLPDAGGSHDDVEKALCTGPFEGTSNLRGVAFRDQ